MDSKGETFFGKILSLNKHNKPNSQPPPNLEILHGYDNHIEGVTELDVKRGETLSANANITKADAGKAMHDITELERLRKIKHLGESIVYDEYLERIKSGDNDDNNPPTAA
ncbi:MAG TPA: hypothetical protein VMR41_02030 [Patescibacteria group bacterium]|nr:hypothetical protein [Patescibacteria group bacterium]